MKKLHFVLNVNKGRPLEEHPDIQYYIDNGYVIDEVGNPRNDAHRSLPMIKVVLRQT